MLLVVLWGNAPNAHAQERLFPEQVADIAWTRLNAVAKKRIETILFAGDPKFLPADHSEAAVRRAFRKAAAFPDWIQGIQNTSFESILYSENRTFLNPTDTREIQRGRCRTWHSYPTPIRYSGPKPTVNPSNALVALNRAVAKLQSLSDSEQDPHLQAWYLYWVEHLVGDLHQPLHCAESFEFGSGDEGGWTFVTGLMGFGNITLLQYWEWGIDRAADMENERSGLPIDVESVTNRWTQDPHLIPLPSDAGNIDVKTWIAEGAKLADTVVYTRIKPYEKPDQAYIDRHAFITKKRTVIAGFRLAKVLNGILGT